MATYEIKNYIKLICLRIDHFESFIVDEKNSSSQEEIEKFIERYNNREGLKIIMIQMNNMEMITFDDVKRIIKNAHVFDYIRKLASEGHKMLPLNNSEIIGIDPILQYMLSSR